MKGNKPSQYATRSVGHQTMTPTPARGIPVSGITNQIYQLQKLYGNRTVGGMVTQYRKATMQRMQDEQSSGSNNAVVLAQIPSMIFEGTGPNIGASLEIEVKGNYVKSIWRKDKEIHSGDVTIANRNGKPVITWVAADPLGQGVGTALMYFTALACQQASHDKIIVDNVIDSAMEYYHAMSFTSYAKETDNDRYYNDVDMIGDTASVLSAAHSKLGKGWIERNGSEQETEQDTEQIEEVHDGSQKGTNKKKNCAIQ